MSKKQILSLLLATVLALLSFISCKPKQYIEEETKKETTTDENGEVVHEPITIMDAQRDYSALIELIHEKYPEIVIEIVPYRGRNMSAYCKQQLETGSMPDIYSTTQAWDSSLQKNGLLDLSQYNVVSLYNTARLEEYVIDGGVYLLPFDYSINGITCNKSLLERNGISVPTSFAELRDVTIPALNAKGIKTSYTLLDLPGSAFQYFFNVTSTDYMNTKDGRTWREEFSDRSSDTTAIYNSRVRDCLDYFQEWIDCGMISYDEGYSNNQSTMIEEFNKGNTAFLIGAVHQYTNDAGDEYCLIPFLSEDGTQNTYITQPTRLYGLNKELGEAGNKQKLIDALHVLEVLSSNEGYKAINGGTKTTTTNMCSIKDFELIEDSYYTEAMQQVGKGHAMNLVYVGWEDYLVPFGEAVCNWIKGELTATESLAVLDITKATLKESGTKYYAYVTEELDTIQAAQLSGQMFMDATGADCALISYNVYNPEITALMENSYGANGHILTGYMSEEYITVFLPTGWYDKLNTITTTGAKIKEMAVTGADTRATGFHYPYVFMTKDGQELEDDKTYTVVLAGYNKSEKGTLGLVDTGIVGLDAAKAYLEKLGDPTTGTLAQISSATLDNSLVISIAGVSQK